MKVIETIDSNRLTYSFRLDTESYTINSSSSVEFPSNIQSFAIITSNEENANKMVFDQLINGWKEFYEASVTDNDNEISGYIVLNATIQEASDLAENAESDYFAFWNSNKLNIFRTHNIELIDVWNL